MVGYFGKDRKNGALFMDMVMARVTQYENRIKEATAGQSSPRTSETTIWQPLRKQA